MQLRLKILLLACAFVFHSHTIAYAHEQAIAFTDITFHTEGDAEDCVRNDCRIEVAHRLSIHDAESTLADIVGTRSDLASDESAQKRLAAYVTERFALASPETGKTIQLSLLGGEVERDFYWVYQEGRIEAGYEGIWVSQTALIDVIPNQTNRVNLRYGGQIKTLVFAGDPAPKLYRFE